MRGRFSLRIVFCAMEPTAARKHPRAGLYRPPISPHRAFKGQSDVQIRIALAKGNGKMPAYGPALGDKGLDAMVKYIRNLKAN